ncbi:DUF2905 domain-containing protein [Marinilongibacter aquaticus]|uniref:DUF2905 domain-containing protein n=1 Tax=Marinilongibacter aquaticus TaxID=2975157 RepID=UPI0021BD345E|nr:DUF2905 domain-containing protein [Marinilongibacter aquaticus]UBM59129.1 DUF2905 domain-containing protein [Marinilongibacter aquaticus]
MLNQNTGKWLIVVGTLVILIGLIFYFFGDKLNWLGKLPGDIRYEKGNTRVYFPITTMVLISLLLNLLIYLIKRFF